MTFSFKKWRWLRSTGTQGTETKDALPSDVCLLDLNDFCAYSPAGEHASVALNMVSRRVPDWFCTAGGHEVARPEHGMAVGWIRPMVVVDVLRRG